LRLCEEKKVPIDHERHLKDAKQKPEYLQIAQGLYLIAMYIEQSAEEIDLYELTAKTSQRNSTELGLSYLRSSQAIKPRHDLSAKSHPRLRSPTLTMDLPSIRTV